jgi:hypothetical protein
MVQPQAGPTALARLAARRFLSGHTSAKAVEQTADPASTLYADRPSPAVARSGCAASGGGGRFPRGLRASLCDGRRALDQSGDQSHGVGVSRLCRGAVMLLVGRWGELHAQGLRRTVPRASRSTRPGRSAQGRAGTSSPRRLHGERRRRHRLSNRPGAGTSPAGSPQPR